MATRTTIPIHYLCAIKAVLILAALLGPESAAHANPADSAILATPQTHRAFVDSCLRELSTHVLSDFTPNRTSPLVILTDTVGDPQGTIASGMAELLSRRGLLIREDTAAFTEDGNWSLRYALAPIRLTLTEPQRREFLGKIWVKRTLFAEVDMSVQDISGGDVVWAGAADSTYYDWVPKGELKSLESMDLKPKPPAGGWERVKIPLVVGGGALLAGILMLALN